MQDTVLNDQFSIALAPSADVTEGVYNLVLQSFDANSTKVVSNEITVWTDTIPINVLKAQETASTTTTSSTTQVTVISLPSFYITAGKARYQEYADPDSL